MRHHSHLFPIIQIRIVSIIENSDNNLSNASLSVSSSGNIPVAMSLRG